MGVLALGFRSFAFRPRPEVSYPPSTTSTPRGVGFEGVLPAGSGTDTSRDARSQNRGPRQENSSELTSEV